MKAVLEFNLPEDDKEYKKITNANLYYDSLWNIRSKIKYILKYATVETDYIRELELIRSMIPFEAMEE